MTIDRDALYDLLPAVYRDRDGQRGEALRQLMDVLTDELAVIADSIDQLYDDLFVETADAWALPYIAELIGLRGLPSVSGKGVTPRAEIANTIGYRRRKGTASVTEQVARDVTGWPARAVEYFELLAATQHVNHVRPANQAVANIRDAARLHYVDTPFERLDGHADLIHTVEVRRIASRRGKYNIPNLGIFLWRIQAWSLTDAPAVPVDPADHKRFLIHPLGLSMPLYTNPEAEEGISHASTPANVPLPLHRHVFADDVAAFTEGQTAPVESTVYYGPNQSLYIDGVPASSVDVCDLSDVRDEDGNVTGWAHTPAEHGRVAIDPMLGRVAFDDLRTPESPTPRVSSHYGFSAQVGGGEYERAATFVTTEGAHVVSNDPELAIPTHDTVAHAMKVIPRSGVVEIVDSGRYGFPTTLEAIGRRIEIRASNGSRPTMILESDLTIDGDGAGEVILNGLLITGGGIIARNLGTLRLIHCTLVPGMSLDANGEREQPERPSVSLETGDTSLQIERSILGPIRAHPDADVRMVDSVVDATASEIAFESTIAGAGGGKVSFEQCTVLGTVHARTIELASNSIFWAIRPDGPEGADWPGPVIADRRQEGCVRFSFLPSGSRTPRRFHCQPVSPSEDGRVRPIFTSLRYPEPGYCQLDRRTPDEIWRGADDGSEMGVFHHLYQPQRLAYLESRLADYLRFGLEAGVFFES